VADHADPTGIDVRSLGQNIDGPDVVPDGFHRGACISHRIDVALVLAEIRVIGSDGGTLQGWP
jgi:hypothetical protein